jgi:hypothetical protein
MPVATLGMWHTEHGGLLTNWKKDRLNHLQIYQSPFLMCDFEEPTLGGL